MRNAWIGTEARVKIKAKGNGQECPFYMGYFAAGKQQVPHRAGRPVRNDKVFLAFPGVSKIAEKSCAAFATAIPLLAKEARSGAPGVSRCAGLKPASHGLGG